MSVFILQMIIIAFAGIKRSHIPNAVRQTTFEKNIGLIANFCWLLAMGYSVFLPLLFGTIWFYLGFSVFSIGVMILSFTTSNFITTPVDQLIQKGMYKFSRHPMYLSTFLICSGAGIASASWIFILLILVMSVCLHFEAIIEEKYCLNNYKDQYREYMNSVPRWFGIPK